MEKEITQEEKVKLFNDGQYACAVPPVCHVRWSDADWIKWIDSNGEWYVDDNICPECSSELQEIDYEKGNCPVCGVPTGKAYYEQLEDK